ncbi:MAG: EamA family transporter [Protaetiibacter sp.]
MSPATGTSPSPVRKRVGVGQLALFTAMFTIWGSSFFFTALALRAFTPTGIILARFTLATIALAAIVLVLRIPLPRGGVVYAHLVALGALNIALPYVMVTYAQQHVESSTAIVLSSTTPLFVFLIAVLILRVERFTVPKVAGIGISFIGVVVLNGVAPPGDGGWIWPLVVVASSAVFASGNVYSRRFLAGVHPIQIALLQIGFGVLFIVPLALLGGPLVIAPPDPIAILAVLELGILGSAVTYVLYFHFIQRWGSTATSINTYLQPVVGVLLGVLVLGEVLSGMSWLALGLILAGVFVFGFATVREARVRRIEVEETTPGV